MSDNTINKDSSIELVVEYRKENQFTLLSDYYVVNEKKQVLFKTLPGHEIQLVTLGDEGKVMLKTERYDFEMHKRYSKLYEVNPILFNHCYILD